MALSFLDNVDYRGKKPNFTRDLFDTVADNKLKDKLLSVDVNTLTPIEAMNILYDLCKIAKEN